MTQPHLTNLNHGRVKGSDEQYTDYGEIDQELTHYTKYIQNKKIFLPCDSSRSEFVRWFREHKELGCRVVYSQADFRSQRSQRFMAEQDIIITNPPFSLIKEFLVPILKMNKPVILIMPQLQVVYMGIGEYFQKGILHIGFTTPHRFTMPDGTVKINNQCIWATNIPLKPRYNRITYSNSPVSSYEQDINGKGIIVRSINDVPRTKKPLLMPINPSSLRYINPSEWYIDARKTVPYIRKGGETEAVFQRLRIRRK